MNNNRFIKKTLSAIAVFACLATANSWGQTMPTKVRVTQQAAQNVSEIRVYNLQQGKEDIFLQSREARCASFVKNKKQKFLILFSLDIPFGDHEQLQKALSKKIFDIDGFMFLDALKLYIDGHDIVYDLNKWNGKGNFVEISNKLTDVYVKRFISYSHNVKRTVKKPNKKIDDALPKDTTEYFVYDYKEDRILTIADILLPEAITENGLDGTSTNLRLTDDGELFCYKDITENGEGKQIYFTEDDISIFTKEFANVILDIKKQKEEELKSIAEDKPLDIAEVMPSFPGGDSELTRWLSRNIKYPAIAEENGVQGRVIVRFVVGKDGSIRDPKVLRSVDPSLDREALRVVKALPRWIPGKQHGEAVSVYFTLPVTFQLQ